jgi:dTDP-4-dehydrorhamnose 3,5-epimerase
MLVPPGCCHGFSVISETATVFYKCDTLYHPESEAGIRYDDPDLNIDWQIPSHMIKVSEKDSRLPLLNERFTK